MLKIMTVYSKHTIHFNNEMCNLSMIMSPSMACSAETTLLQTHIVCTPFYPSLLQYKESVQITLNLR